MRHPLRRLLISLAFIALWPFGALAQSPAGNPPPLPACIPLVNGFPAGVPRWEWGQVGEHLFQPCRARLGAPVVWYGISCLHGSCKHRLLGEAMTEVTRASAKVTTARRLWEANVLFDYSVAVEQTPRGALAREWGAILARRKAIWMAS